MKKRISIIGTVGLPARYGGWETLVDHITRHLANKYEITVFCSSNRYDEKILNYNGVKLRYVNIDANGVQSIFYDLVSMIKSLNKSDVLLILGVSGCVFLPIIKLFSKQTIIVNIDGMEWKRAKWNNIAKWFLKLSEKVAVMTADIIVADNKAIQEYIEGEYRKPSKLIAYGADHVKNEKISEEINSKYPFLREKYVFKVCRIEPENNLDIILNVFEKMTDLNLVIVGNWSNSKYGIELTKKYSKFSNIHLIDPIYDQKILNQLRSNCYIYVHGHSAGGTNPSLVEAMGLGLPIIAFSVNYNIETTYGKAVYFKDEDELYSLLRELQPAELDEIAITMKNIAKTHYSWANISQKYAELFNIL